MKTWAAKTHTETGKVRALNEDSVLDLSGEQLWAVADGMGGHDGGDYASQRVAESLSSYRQCNYRGIAIKRLTSLLEGANRHLYDKAQEGGKDVIGSTVAVLSLHFGCAVCTWSGDSRIFRLRAGQLTQLTRDHNFLSLSDDRDRNVHSRGLYGDGSLLTNAIGGDVELQIEHSWYELLPGDSFLLCSDGLYNEVAPEQLTDTINEYPDPQQFVGELASLYGASGARDNVGLVFVYPD